MSGLLNVSFFFFFSRLFKTIWIDMPFTHAVSFFCTSFGDNLPFLFVSCILICYYSFTYYIHCACPYLICPSVFVLAHTQHDIYRDCNQPCDVFCDHAAAGRCC